MRAELRDILREGMRVAEGYNLSSIHIDPLDCQPVSLVWVERQVHYTNALLDLGKRCLALPEAEQDLLVEKGFPFIFK